MRTRIGWAAALLLGALPGCGGSGGDDIGKELELTLVWNIDHSGNSSVNGFAPEAFFGDAIEDVEVEERGLVAFSLERIPAGSVVESAVLEVETSSTGDPLSLGNAYAVPADLEFVGTFPLALSPEAVLLSTPSGQPSTTFAGDVASLVEDAVAGITPDAAIGLRFEIPTNLDDGDDYAFVLTARLRIVLKTP